MKIHTMKVFHWANQWPEEYLEALERLEQLYPCNFGHEECSMCLDGPCKRKVNADASN